ncbi:Vesicle-associated membrane protein 1, partial [Varanus komodoensis]
MLAIGEWPEFLCCKWSDPAQPPTPGPEGGENAGGPPGPPPNLTSNRRLQQTQVQVEEVVDIMRVNVDKVLKRDQMLSELDERADALQAGAQVFESSAAALKRKYWWKNCKMMIMLGVICAIVVIAIARDGACRSMRKSPIAQSITELEGSVPQRLVQGHRFFPSSSAEAATKGFAPRQNPPPCDSPSFSALGADGGEQEQSSQLLWISLSHLSGTVRVEVRRLKRSRGPVCDAAVDGRGITI